MKPTNLALINIEAEGAGRNAVSRETVDRVSAALGIVKRDAPAVSGMDAGTAAAVEALVGSKALSAMTVPEYHALASAISRLPEPVGTQSFAWSAIRKPADVDPLLRAVVMYHRFNAGAVDVSEAIGANDEFRRFVRQSNAAPDTLLSSVLEDEQRYVDRIVAFKESMGDFVSNASGVFGGDEWTIGALLVLTSAIGGLHHSRETLENGWSLPHAPTQDCLDAFENVRLELAYVAKSIADTYGVNLLKYSLTSLSGLRRSLAEGGADFHSAISSFGIEIEGEAGLVDVAREVNSFLSVCNRLDAVLEDGGYSEADASALMSHVVMRRYLVSAAEANGIEWHEVSRRLTPLPSAGPEAIRDLMEALSSETFSAKLDSISKDKTQSIVNVQLAADHYTYTRQYWLDAGARVVGRDPGIRMEDMKSILEMEPEIHGNTEILQNAGAVGRGDIDELERHLEWMIAVYGMPVSNSAIEVLVSSKGAAASGIVNRPA